MQETPTDVSPGKHEYAAPTLVRFGSVADLTATTTIGSDEPGSGTKKRPSLP
jgi:hypothetical protein